MNARRRNIFLGALALLVLAGGFAVFRPDKAVTNQRVEDTIPEDVAAALQSTTSTPAAEAAPGSGEATTPSTVPAPRVLASGSFTGQANHSVTGRAAVVDSATGPVLVLEDLDSENGPDLKLYLSPSAEGNVDGGVLVEPLRGNQGTQIYPLPAGVDLAATPNVVIWCERFSTPFGTATLT